MSVEELPSEEFDLGRRLKLIREIKGVRQSKVAEYLDMTTSGYSRIERNEVRLTIDKLILFCRKMGVSIDDFLTLSDIVLLKKVSLESYLVTEEELDLLSKIEEGYVKQINLLKEEVKYLREVLSKKIDPEA